MHILALLEAQHTGAQMRARKSLSISNNVQRAQITYEDGALKALDEVRHLFLSPDEPPSILAAVVENEPQP